MRLIRLAIQLKGVENLVRLNSNSVNIVKRISKHLLLLRITFVSMESTFVMFVWNNLIQITFVNNTISLCIKRNLQVDVVSNRDRGFESEKSDQVPQGTTIVQVGLSMAKHTL